MNYVFYFGFGIITHLIAWGSELYGLQSIALIIFWPFYIVWQLILFVGFYILPIIVIILAASYIWDRVREARGLRRRYW